MATNYEELNNGMNNLVERIRQKRHAKDYGEYLTKIDNLEGGEANRICKEVNRYAKEIKQYKKQFNRQQRKILRQRLGVLLDEQGNFLGELIVKMEQDHPEFKALRESLKNYGGGLIQKIERAYLEGCASGEMLTNPKISKGDKDRIKILREMISERHYTGCIGIFQRAAYKRGYCKMSELLSEFDLIFSEK